ncbi:MAG: 50S ribosomal protein L18 [bacterium]|nr:50S ribosomal protein L18 [bacterium]
MANSNINKVKRIRRHAKIRTRLSGTADKPRLAVFRSNRFMYAQLIDDDANKTLASASSVETKSKKAEAAFKVGQEIAKKALALKVSSVVFDRGGFGYKGRVKSLADGAREGGLKF